MNFKEQLVDSSKMLMELVAQNVGCNVNYYNEVMSIALNEPTPFSSRAGRVVYICTLNYPYLFQPHVKTVISYLKKHKGLQHSILKIFAEIPVKLTEAEEGILINTCFELLADDNQTIAAKAYSMDILGNFGKKEPEIIPELISLCDELYFSASAGIKSRIMKIRKKLLR